MESHPMIGVSKKGNARWATKDNDYNSRQVLSLNLKMPSSRYYVRWIWLKCWSSLTCLTTSSLRFSPYGKGWSKTRKAKRKVFSWESWAVDDGNDWLGEEEEGWIDDDVTGTTLRCDGDDALLAGAWLGLVWPMTSVSLLTGLYDMHFLHKISATE